VKPATRAALATIPGCAVIVATLAGWAPAWRDLPGYFVPLRYRTAQVIAGASGPFWNPDTGCGEPFFANPQSGLLYPPAWLAAVVPAPTAVWLEIGVHLAILGLGTLLLARRLHAPPWFELAAAWGVALAGPAIDAGGVLNNLDSLAWLPWLWWAVLGGSWRGAAAFGALAYLGAEPQLALVGFLIAVFLAPRRSTIAGLALAFGLIAVQALPFGAWVRGGDRGAGKDLFVMTAGSVETVELPAFALPGTPVARRSDQYVPHPTVPLWVLALGVAAIAGRSRPARVLACAGWALLAASVVPSVRNGDVIWAAVTGGFVRYPGRLAYPAAVALTVAAAASVRRRAAWIAAVPATAALVGSLAVGASVGGSLVQGASAGLVVTGVGAPAAAIAGELALVPLLGDVTRAPSLHALRHSVCLQAQIDPRGRAYAVPLSKEQLAWVQEDNATRGEALGLGYPALDDGRRVVRTYAPLESSVLAAHIAEADKGPSGLWWLDSLAATRVVAQHPLFGFPELCRDGELRVCANPSAWPEASVVRRLPSPGEEPQSAGQVLAVAAVCDQRRWSVRVAAGGGVLQWLATPDPGWHYRVDGSPTPATAGPGIIHGVPVPPGLHEVTASYRPPGFAAGAVISTLSVLVLLGGAWRRW